MFSRRHFCLAAISAVAAPAIARAGSSAGFAEDFDLLWRTLDAGYCFFDEKATDWAKVRSFYRPRAAAADSQEAFSEIARLTLNELYDAHTHLGAPSDGTPRWPPFDVSVARHPQGAVVVEVREGSAAEAAGLSRGQVINAVDGVEIAEAALGQRPACLSRADEAANLYALNAAVAGRRGQARAFGLSTGAMLDLPLQDRSNEPDISFRMLADGFGYIRIASFANDSAISAFDAALEALRSAPGLILDVRRNGGGDTAVARPIMGRFIHARAPYARMRRREGAGLSPAWTEFVEPRGPFTYDRPVVVLTDLWSASMAEGFPMGMRGLGRARIVGRPMMGLGAAVLTFDLPFSGLSLQYSAEPVYDIADQPRWRLSPDVIVQPGADILSAGSVELAQLVAG